jgi:hypothetical protein
VLEEHFHKDELLEKKGMGRKAREVWPEILRYGKGAFERTGGFGIFIAFMLQLESREVSWESHWSHTYLVRFSTLSLIFSIRPLGPPAVEIHHRQRNAPSSLPALRFLC